MANFRTKLRDAGITPRQLSRMTGIAEPHIHCLLTGSRRPSVETAKKIEAVTGGAIKWTEFFEVQGSASPEAA